MTTAADVLVETLMDWDVDVVFGLPGDGINGIMEALRKRRDEVRFIQARHEESAALMACAYSKYTGRLGVCLATSGPGGIHLLNGLYDAKLDGAAVLAVTGLQFHDLIGTRTQQDVELDRTFMDVALYNARVMGPGHVESVVDLACRTALAGRGVSHVTIPVDTQDMAVERRERSKRNVPHHTSAVRAAGAKLPAAADLVAAAEILNAGRRVAILAGRGALGASDQLERIAEKLAAPIVKPLLGKACVPDDSPYTTGGIGLLGTAPSQKALETCDTLLIVGTSFPYIEFYPKPGQARSVQIELDPMRIGLRSPVEVGLVGDSRRTLDALLPMLDRKEDRSFLERAQEGMGKWREIMEGRETRAGSPMKPQVVARELGRRLPSDAILSCDSGTVTAWWARHIPAKRGQMHSCSGNLATMACGVPYAIAAAVAYPDRLSVAFVGDGGCSMLMAEIATCVKYRLNVKIIVVKNNTLGQIKWEQVAFLGNPEFGVELQPIDFAGVARACGAAAFSVGDAAACGAVLDEALATPGPVLVEALVDPNEPPLPANVTFEQAKNFVEAVVRGEPEGAKIALNVIAGKVRELV